MNCARQRGSPQGPAALERCRAFLYTAGMPNPNAISGQPPVTGGWFAENLLTVTVEEALRLSEEDARNRVLGITVVTDNGQPSDQVLLVAGTAGRPPAPIA